VYDGEKIYEMSNQDFKYEYRNSILKGNHNFVILSCTFKLEKGNIDDIKALILDRTTRRISTQDLKNPSNGSVFRNPEISPAGKLIDDAGLKGTTVNDAQVSNIHANFIINKGNATSEDIIKLIEIVKEKVKEIHNVELHLEQEIIK
jgi:UDP-N-acetylmuramate dehydrogenase